VLGILLGCAAWWFLVRASIDFARLATGGEPRAWAFATASSVGAVLCLLLVLVLASRMLVTLGLVSEYRPRRAAPKRRVELAREPARDGTREPARDGTREPARDGTRETVRDGARRRASRHGKAPEADRTVS